jgi:hypothetical protein
MYIVTSDLWLLKQPATEDFWQFCHWVGAMLHPFVVGAVGLVLEVADFTSAVGQKRRRHLVNQLLMAAYLFWLGCFVMTNDFLGFWNGMLAWVASFGALLVAFCADPKMPKQVDDTSADLEKADVEKVAVAESVKAEPEEPQAMQVVPTEVSKEPSLAPEGGWNSLADASRTFGVA